MQDPLPIAQEGVSPRAGDLPESGRGASGVPDSWFRSLVEQSIAGTYVIRDGRFEYVNPKLADLFGYSVEELVAAKTVGDLVVEEDRERVLENIRRRLAGEVESIHSTFRGLRRDGTVLEVETHGTRAELAGEPVVIGLLLDVTRRLELEREREALLEEARRALEARDEVLAVVSHDLRNPLNAIVMTADLLLMQEGEDGPRAEMLRRIKRITGSMEVLIRDLLDVSAAEAGRLPVEVEPRSVREILRAVEEMLLPQAQERGVRFEVRLTEAVVLADHDRVVQVLSNLVGNALKFTPAGGWIRVEARVDGRAVHFVVEDTGCGIPEGDRSLLFERFWRGSGSGTGGAGLGLAIARGIVEAHGSEIWVESEVGKGTRIGFALARHLAAASG